MVLRAKGGDRTVFLHNNTQGRTSTIRLQSRQRHRNFTTQVGRPLTELIVTGTNIRGTRGTIKVQTVIYEAGLGLIARRRRQVILLATVHTSRLGLRVQRRGTQRTQFLQASRRHRIRIFVLRLTRIFRQLDMKGLRLVIEGRHRRTSSRTPVRIFQRHNIRHRLRHTLPQHFRHHSFLFRLPHHRRSFIRMQHRLNTLHHRNRTLIKASGRTGAGLLFSLIRLHNRHLRNRAKVLHHHQRQTNLRSTRGITWNSTVRKWYPLG